MTCEDRVKKLPAYLEGELSPQESEEFKAHLASCETCRETLEALKAADRLVRNLGEVDPPPWLKQQIMTRVREAHAERERFWRKFFFPLHIKIPVQAFVVIIVSVLAFYIYRQDEPRLRMRGIPLPPTQVFEVQKEQAIPSPRSSRSKMITPSRDMTVPREALMPAPQPGRSEDGDAYTSLAPAEKGEDVMPTELKRDARETSAAEEPASAEKSQVPQNEAIAWPITMKEKRAASRPPQTISGASSRICEQDVCTAGELEGRDGAGDSVAKGAAMKEMAVKDAQPSLALLLTVKDVASAGVELDKYLATVNARHTEITFHGEQQAFATEVRPHFVASVLKKLNQIGLLADHPVPPEFEMEAQWVKMKITIMPAVNQNP